MRIGRTFHRDAQTFLVHLFGRGLDDERYVVETYRSLPSGEIRPVEAGHGRRQGAATPRRTSVSPCLNGPASPPPTVMTIMVIGPVRRSRARASAPIAIAMAIVPVSAPCRNVCSAVGPASDVTALARLYPHRRLGVQRRRHSLQTSRQPCGLRSHFRRNSKGLALTVSISNLCPARRFRALVLTPDAARCRPTTTLRSGTRRVPSATKSRSRA